MPQLETKNAKHKRTNSLLCNLYQSKVEGHRDAHKLEVERLRQQPEAKDSFCEAKKLRVLSELQADYNAKLPALYDEQYDIGYWAGVASCEHTDRPGMNSVVSPIPFEQNSAPLLVAEPSIEGAWTVPVLMPSGKRSSSGAEAAGSEPVLVIQEKLPPVSESFTIVLEELPLLPIVGSPIPAVDDVN